MRCAPTYPGSNPGVEAKIKTNPKGRFEFLAAQDFTNLNRFINETVNIVESLADVDFWLYNAHKHQSDKP